MTSTSNKPLECLISEACEEQQTNSLTSRDRNRLLRYVQRSSLLLPSTHPNYLEALNRTYEWLLRHLHEFQAKPSEDLETTFFRWINNHLSWRLKDLRTVSNSTYSLDQVMGRDHDSETYLEQTGETGWQAPTLEGLDALLLQDNHEAVQRLFARFEGYVATDPEGRLQACHPRRYPECNAQALCQQVLLYFPQKQLRTISREFGINEQTLYSHWEKKCKPLLRDILRELGYKPEGED